MSGQQRIFLHQTNVLFCFFFVTHHDVRSRSYSFCIPLGGTFGMRLNKGEMFRGVTLSKARRSKKIEMFNAQVKFNVNKTDVFVTPSTFLKV